MSSLFYYYLIFYLIKEKRKKLNRILLTEILIIVSTFKISLFYSLLIQFFKKLIILLNDCRGDYEMNILYLIKSVNIFMQ